MPEFGKDTASFLAAGEEDGIRALVEEFYRQMDSLPEARKIREMHAESLEESREKLTIFLTGWLGGPRNYETKFGPIRIPAAHSHLKIGQAERDAWMLCMERAVDCQSWSEEFKDYFMKQIAVPADRVQQISGRKRL